MRQNNYLVRSLIAAFTVLFVASILSAQVLLDDKWADGSRAESKRPAEAAVWVGRAVDLNVAPGALSTKLGTSSQKLWTYFTDTAPATLAVGQKLNVSVTFIPKVKLSDGTSRSLRIGVFHDPTSPRVEVDTADDGGGAGKPWTDSQGYGLNVLVTGDSTSRTKPFDLGKRINLQSQNLLGSSSDYIKLSGGEPVVLQLDTPYTVTLEITRISDKQVDLTAVYYKGSEQLSTWTVSDDGSSLGSQPAYDKFDQLYVRLSNNATTADQIDFTNFKVELSPAASTQ